MAGTLDVYIVDAFTGVPFAGNPAAVCPIPYCKIVDEKTLQNIAMEMNLSETAYIRPLNATDDFKTGSRFGLRWFTPEVEVKLCGHATLASSAVLFYQIGNTSESITFDTKSGDLVVKKDGDHLSMDFPLGKIEKRSPADYGALVKVLCGSNLEVKDICWCESLEYLLVRIEDGWTMSQFQSWKPDIAEFGKTVSAGLSVLIVTTRGTAEAGYVDSQGRSYDFVSRCFAPWTGVNEDPVTGSAQTVLADYWKAQLSKDSFYARQCSSRGGDVEIKVIGDRVHLRGKATMVMKGQLLM